MDDRKVFELKTLELAYKKQLQFMLGLMTISVIGLILYIITVYKYNFSLFIIAVVIIFTGIIGIMTVDQKMKLISTKIRKL